MCTYPAPELCSTRGICVGIGHYCSVAPLGGNALQASLLQIGVLVIPSGGGSIFALKHLWSEFSEQITP